MAIDYRQSGVDYRNTTHNYDGGERPTLSASLSSSASISAVIVEEASIASAISSAASISGTITATTAVVPDASDGATLGSASLEWSDLYLADAAVIYFGDDQDIRITHAPDSGLTTDGQFQATNLIATLL